MSKRRIYSDELKLMVVQIYMSEQMSINEIVNKYHVDKTSLKKWIYQYKEHGEKGLCTD